MGKGNSSRKLLGLSQMELAMLLGVQRSQLSMYESGQRRLPTAAAQLLNELLIKVAGSDSAGERKSQVVHVDEQRLLKRLLADNQHQQAILARKLAAADRKDEAAARKRRLADALQNPSDASKAQSELSSRMIIAKTTAPQKLNDQRFLLQIKHEVLELEKSLLESKLLKCNIK